MTRVIIAQLPVSNNMAELPGLVQAGPYLACLLAGPAEIDGGTIDNQIT